ETDRPFTDKVSGRFDIGSSEEHNVPGHPDFDYYGDNGLPELKAGGDLHARAAALEKEFGMAFTGSDPSWFARLVSGSSESSSSVDEAMASLDRQKTEKRPAAPARNGDGESLDDLKNQLANLEKQKERYDRLAQNGITTDERYATGNTAEIDKVK